MSMARFETGPGGNAHYHGFNVGTPGPQVLRVKADVEGDGDEAPQTVRLDVRTVSRALRREWKLEQMWSREEVLEWVGRVLADDDSRLEAVAGGDPDLHGDGLPDRRRHSTPGWGLPVNLLTALFAGGLFGAGLVISQMTNSSR